MRKRCLISNTILAFCLLLAEDDRVFAQVSSLRTSLQDIRNTMTADVGISILDLESNDTLSLNGDFPMQSVFKFHIALAVLRQVDEGKLSLEKNIMSQKINTSKPGVCSCGLFLKRTLM